MEHRGITRVSRSFATHTLVNTWSSYGLTIGEPLHDSVIFQHLGVLFTYKAVHCYTLLGIHSWDVYITSKPYYIDIVWFTKLHTQAHEFLRRSTSQYLKTWRLATNSQTFFANYHKQISSCHTLWRIIITTKVILKKSVCQTVIEFVGADIGQCGNEQKCMLLFQNRPEQSDLFVELNEEHNEICLFPLAPSKKSINNFSLVNWKINASLD